MDNELYREQAQRARDLAEKADPSTRKRLLALAKKYVAKADASSKPTPLIEPPLPLPTAVPIPRPGQSGEA